MSGESLIVPAGVYHYFIALTDVVAVETYYRWKDDVPVREDDIDRLNESGRYDIINEGVLAVHLKGMIT